MNFLEVIQASTAVLEAVSQFLAKSKEAAPTLKRIAYTLRGNSSYESLSLDLVFDIRDPRGERAVVKRTQRVRFSVDDSGIIRDVVWGEGNPLWRYSVTGARCVGVRQEGSRRAVLLALARKPNRGDEALVSTSRMVRDPVPGTIGYAESYLERPTRRLALRVLFPRTRPPQEAHLVALPSNEASKSIPVRYGRDGRPYLTWSIHRPEKYVTYSLRWAW